MIYLDSHLFFWNMMDHFTFFHEVVYVFHLPPSRYHELTPKHCATIVSLKVSAPVLLFWHVFRFILEKWIAEGGRVKQLTRVVQKECEEFTWLRECMGNGISHKEHLLVFQLFMACFHPSRSSLLHIVRKCLVRTAEQGR